VKVQKNLVFEYYQRENLENQVSHIQIRKILVEVERKTFFKGFDREERMDQVRLNFATFCDCEREKQKNQERIR